MKHKFLFLWLILVTAPLIAQTKPDALREYRQGNYQQAIEICRSELKVSPKNMDAHTVLGWSLIRLGKYREALESGMAGLKQSRRDIRIIEIVAEAHFFLGNNLDGLKYFEEYCVLAPTGERIGVVYFYMGETFIRMGEYHHADIALTTAVYHSSNIAKWWAA